MASFLDYFKAALIIQLFWSISVVLLINTIPTQDLHYLTFASSDASASAINSVSGKMQSAMESETKIPIVDTATLIFFSGNIISDLIANFVAAIPQMFDLFLYGIFTLFPIDYFLQASIRSSLFILISVLYIFSMLSFLTNLRSGGSVI